MFRELSPPETYAALSEDDTAVLIDCRSAAEWHFTGIPDLSAIGKKPLLVAIADEGGRPNPDFVSQVSETVDVKTPVYVICRVGGRSANACRMLAEADFTTLANVTERHDLRMHGPGIDPCQPAA